MASKKDQRSLNWFIIIAGLVLLLLFIAIAVFIPCPTSSQFNLFRIIIPLAAAAFAAGIPGQFQFKSKAVQATAAIGVFALAYLVNPAGWVTKDDCRGLRNFRGIVFVDGKEQESVEVIVPSINRNAFTDAFGNFNIEYSDDLINYPLTVRFRYKTLLDTAIVYNEVPDKKIEFRFSINHAVSSSVSVSGNAASFSNKDLSLVVSLTDNPYENASDFPDSVQYVLTANKDTLAIDPYGNYIDNFFNGKVVQAVPIASEMQRLAAPAPKLDFKIVNNSQDAVFVTGATLEVAKSSKDNSAFLIIANGHYEIYISNAGWGSANNATIDYTLSPMNGNNHWSDNFEDHVEVGTISSGTQSAERSITEVGFRNALIRKGTDPAYFSEEARAAAELAEDAEKRKQQLTGAFYRGGFISGRINYTEDDGKQRSVKFTAILDLWAEAGAAIDASALYNTALKAEGENYTVNIPLSQGIRPKDFDRFFLTLHAPQSSFHVFRIKFSYNNNQVFELPVLFRLRYFNTPEGVKYTAKISKVR